MYGLGVSGHRVGMRDYGIGLKGLGRMWLGFSANGLAFMAEGSAFRVSRGSGLWVMVSEYPGVEGLRADTIRSDQDRVELGLDFKIESSAHEYPPPHPHPKGYWGILLE